MRVLLAIVAGLCLALSPSFCQVPAPAASSPGPPETTPAAQTNVPTPQQPLPKRPCNGKNAQDCGVSKQELKKARQAFEKGNRLQKHNLEQALAAFEEAARLVPRSPEYVLTRERVRQQLVYDHLKLANQLSAEKRTVESGREFQKVLQLEPENQIASAALREFAVMARASQAAVVERSPEDQQTVVRPKAGRQSFHLSGDARMAFSAVTRAFGIKADFDPSIRSGTVRLDLEKADFFEAMSQLCALTRTFWTPVTSTQVVIAADTPTAHKELDRWLQRTFYLPEFSSAQELNDVVNLLRSIFEIRAVTQQPATATVTVRGPAPVVNAATTFLESLSTGRPEVMLDFEVFQVNRQMLQTVGVSLPLQFNVFNIPQSALKLLGNTNIQDLINQLMASGGLTEANMSAISALIAQFQSQQSSLFSQPVATFGGGTTLMGIGVPPGTVNLSRNESRVDSLQRVTLRASEANAATLRIGTRYPILNSSFTSLYNNTPQLASLLGGSGNLGSVPSISYEDLGIVLTAKPKIHGTSEVTLDLDMQLRALAGSSLNGNPVINQRAYKGVISLRDGEPVVVAGAVSENEQKSLSGIPGIGRIPGLGRTTSSKDTTHEQDELLIVVTPHISSAGRSGSTPAILMPHYGQ